MNLLGQLDSVLPDIPFGELTDERPPSIPIAATLFNCI